MSELLSNAGQGARILTAGEFLAMDSDDRTELLGGVLHDVSPRNEPHRHAVRKLVQVLSRELPSGLIVQSQDAVAVPDWGGRDAPEIDVAVIADEYFRPGPQAADARAFIEVADTTYAHDRNHKIPLYVRAGVPAWIVNIPRRRVEFYASPADLAAECGRVFDDGATFDVLGISIRVADLLVEP